ncbi:hypothetical protein HMPREF0424_0085 [Gardnerella vaginalis 409-05]|nr:hypothetical protein HMPREF0424_0085 [Gardnerella vaginalis 409-05]EFH71520.1 hypothetical protein GV51_0418 [Gardnerella vaginalis 5-1]
MLNYVRMRHTPACRKIFLERKASNKIDTQSRTSLATHTITEYGTNF